MLARRIRWPCYPVARDYEYEEYSGGRDCGDHTEIPKTDIQVASDSKILTRQEAVAVGLRDTAPAGPLVYSGIPGDDHTGFRHVVVVSYAVRLEHIAR